jgi:hypothetical protein
VERLVQIAKNRAAVNLIAICGLLALTVNFEPTTIASETTADSLPAASGSSQPAADEDVAKFIQRYLDAVATAKSPKQLLPYMKPRADMPPMPEATSEEDKKMEAKMMAAFMEMQQASTPLHVEETGRQNSGGKILVLLKVTQVSPQAKLNLSEPGASATGKILLEKGPAGWLVAEEFWHYVYPNGLTTNTGHDPDAAPKVASPIDKYSDDIMSALNKVWLDPVKGIGQVTVEFKNSSSGNFELITVRDKHGSKEAETAVAEAMAKISLPPLPDEVSEQPIVNIQLCWSPKSKDTLKIVQLLHSATLEK